MIGCSIGILVAVLFVAVSEWPFKDSAYRARAWNEEVCFTVRAPHPLAGLYCIRHIERGGRHGRP